MVGGLGIEPSQPRPQFYRLLRVLSGISPHEHHLPKSNGPGCVMQSRARLGFIISTIMKDSRSATLPDSCCRSMSHYPQTRPSTRTPPKRYRRGTATDSHGSFGDFAPFSISRGAYAYPLRMKKNQQGFALPSYENNHPVHLFYCQHNYQTFCATAEYFPSLALRALKQEVPLAI